MTRALTILPLLLLLAACTTTQPPQIAAPAPPPVIVPPKPVVTLDWRDRPYTQGAWHYADRAAHYGMDGAAPALIMRCDAARRTVSLSVPGTISPLVLRTSYGERSWPATASGDGRSTITLAASDPALDQIAFSRGRFSLSGVGMAEVDIPAWAEPSRVVEDCRG